ncbi:m7GpppX diphosphatase [Phytophthora nicotianae]|uniref:M7GpppX diphosphatase n=1 Tax=Phytophthora nicotianae TaxID=4792 RepID=A0A0W8BYM8_PHYNI|nr:m7GpppX diphosphatase [Phytophthora nicotianae]
MELLQMLWSVQFVLALAVMLLSAFVFWRMSLAGLGTSKMLRNFNLERVLKRTDTELALLGNFKSDKLQQAAVVVIQTAAMDVGALGQLLTGMSLHKILTNDIYSTFQGDVSRDFKPYKVNLIYPATERHIQKHTDQNFYMVVETKETYQTITKPYIDSIPVENIEWVYNILDHKSETERVICEDADPRDGFILLPDFKWSDPSNVRAAIKAFYLLESLYCLAIVHDRSLRSLRDLTGTHLKLLHNIRYIPHVFCFLIANADNLKLTICLRLETLVCSSIRMYFHYQPTYYHLHVHFSHVKMTLGTFSGKAVLLDDVIYNLSANGDHYKNASLSFVIGEMQHKPLFELYRDKKIV